MVQWLGLSPVTALAWVQSLLQELRSYKLHNLANKNKFKLHFSTLLPWEIVHHSYTYEGTT